jgi:hypothetical protein
MTDSRVIDVFQVRWLDSEQSARGVEIPRTDHLPSADPAHCVDGLLTNVSNLIARSEVADSVGRIRLSGKHDENLNISREVRCPA